jgi:hypothetical protein
MVKMRTLLYPAKCCISEPQILLVKVHRPSWFVESLFAHKLLMNGRGASGVEWTKSTSVERSKPLRGLRTPVTPAKSIAMNLTYPERGMSDLF